MNLNDIPPPPLPLPQPKDLGIALVTELILPALHACKPHIPAGTLPVVYVGMFASIFGMMADDLGQETARKVLSHMHPLLMAQEFDRGRLQ